MNWRKDLRAGTTFLSWRLIVASFLLFGPSAFAIRPELGDLHEDPKSLSMGRAATAITEDYTALYQNPAGLGLVKESTFTMFILSEAGLKTLSLLGVLDDVRALTAGQSDTGAALSNAMTILDPYRNQNMHARLSLGAYWVWNDGPFFLDDMGGGMNVQFRFNPYITENLMRMVMRGTVDGHIAAGKAFTFFPEETLRLGVASRLGYRASAEIETNLASQIASQTGSAISLTGSGMGERVWIDIDAGLQYDFPIFTQYRPRIGVAVLNLLNEVELVHPGLFSGSSRYPLLYQRRLNIGLSSGLPEFWIFRPTFAFDIRNIGVWTDSFFNRVHVGVDIEFLLFDWWDGSIRLGMDQGYFTAGGSGKLGALGIKGTLDLVYYAREVGAAPGQNADHRVLLQLGLEI